MKTTIEIADALLDEARRTAEREKTTVRALVEEGLRDVLRARRAQKGKFRLRRASVPGRGLRAGLEGASWEDIRDLAYRGRGA